MNVGLKVVKLLLFFVFVSLTKNGFAQGLAVQIVPAAEFSCSKASLVEFVHKWNKETGKLKTGTWKLPLLRKETNYEQALDGPGLSIKIKSTTLGCLDTVEIWSRRDESISIAAQVAWVKTIKVLEGNPKDILHQLGIHKPLLHAGGKTEQQGIIYTFTESINDNSFRAVVM